MNRTFFAAAIVLSCWFACADVWQDCTAWYMGGSATVGDFANGNMTDLRHAAIVDSPTHGGTYRGNLLGISNLCESVYSAASGRTFANQRTIYLAQRETTSGTYKVYENDVALPFAATNNNYTLLMRVKLDEVQPHNNDFVYVADFGYSGGTDKYAFGIRYYPGTEEIGFLYNNGSGKEFFALTNDVCTTLRGKWLELSVSLELRSQTDTKDKCRMRLGLAAEGLERVYKLKDYEFPKGQAVPKAGKIYLAGTTGYGGASTSCYPARGSYQMVSYWERVLTDDEILEAFKMQGPDGTAACEPALLKVGDPAWSSDVFGATIEGTSATPSLDLQDLAKIPLQIAAGQTLNLPFTVPATCTNLAQIVRLAVANDSSSASVQVKVDEQNVNVADVVSGKAVCVLCAAALFTEGAHTLTLTRSDSGTGLMKLESVEISGSWRLGWIDNSYAPFQADTESSKTIITNFVRNLTTNDWPSFRGTIKSTRIAALSVRLSEADVTTRRVFLRTKPYNMPSSTFDFAILANDVEVFRRTVSSKDKDEVKYALAEISFRPDSLKAGDNVFVFKTDNLVSGSGSWYRLDYVELEVGTAPTGCMILFK